MSETGDITNLVTGAAMKPSILTDHWGREHVMLPTIDGNGRISFQRQDITPKGAVKIDPAFIDAAVNIDQVDSLITYVNRFKTADTVILADLEETEIVAVIDYHKAASEAPGLAEHHAILKLVHSAEWKAWSAIDGRMYTQQAFAHHLDINKDDVVGPIAGASLLERILDLETSVKIEVNRRLRYSGSNAGEGGTKIEIKQGEFPPTLSLAIPVFGGRLPVIVTAHVMQTTDKEGKTSFGVILARTKIIVEKELELVVAEIAKATSVPVMMGSLATS